MIILSSNVFPKSLESSVSTLLQPLGIFVFLPSNFLGLAALLIPFIALSTAPTVVPTTAPAAAPAAAPNPAATPTVHTVAAIPVNPTAPAIPLPTPPTNPDIIPPKTAEPAPQVNTAPATIPASKPAHIASFPINPKNPPLGFRSKEYLDKNPSDIKLIPFMSFVST